MALNKSKKIRRTQKLATKNTEETRKTVAASDTEDAKLESELATENEETQVQDEDGEADYVHEDEEDGLFGNPDKLVSEVMVQAKSRLKATFAVQLRLPSELEPYYKGLAPSVKKTLRDAFAVWVRKAYDRQ